MVLAFWIQSLNFGQVVIGILLSLEYSLVFTVDASLFNHIMVREEQDIPNWNPDESGRFTLKSARNFFLERGVPCC